MSKGRTVATVTIGRGKRNHILKMHAGTYCGLGNRMSDKTKETSLKGNSLCINCRVAFRADTA